MKFFASKIPLSRQQYGLVEGKIYDEMPASMSSAAKTLYAKEGWIVPFEDFLPNVPVPDIASIPEPCEVEIFAKKQGLPKAFINDQEVTINGMALSLLPEEFVVRIATPEYIQPSVVISGNPMPSKAGCSFMLSAIGEPTVTIYVPVIRSSLSKTVLNLTWTKVVSKITITDEAVGRSMVMYQRPGRVKSEEE